jgi:tRNA-specific 2-thiouridylase
MLEKEIGKEIFVGMSPKESIRMLPKGQAGGKKKVYLGLSGGVDSSVSAALLKKAGFDVVGVFIKVWQPDFVECTWKEDRLDAMRVCAKLKIPFITLDLGKEYKRDVADYMINEYKAGRTPNPDVMCNKYVKFGAFFDWAMKKGADFVATGHYTRIVQQGQSLISDIKDCPCCLLAGKDKNKDQSYFLWTLTQRQLSKTLFPVGDIEKPEVRKIAKKLDLSTSDKKDSQGICFLGKFDMKDFLAHYIKERSGKVLNEKGEEIGSHKGVLSLTIGQRHGFEITKKTPDDKPYYIISKDIKKNTITVSQDKELTTPKESKIIKLKNINWTVSEPDLSKKYQARIRYRQSLEKCIIKKTGSNYSLIFDNPQKSVSSGQSAVIYDKDICLGGGIIEA